MKKKILIVAILLVVVVGISVFLYRYGVNPNVIRIVNAEKIFEIREVYTATSRAFPDLYGYIPKDYYIVLTKDGTLCKYTTGSSYIEGKKHSEYTIEKTKKLNKEEITQLTMEIESLNNIEFDYSSQSGTVGGDGIGYRITQDGKSKHVDKSKLNNILNKYGFEF